MSTYLFCCCPPVLLAICINMKITTYLLTTILKIYKLIPYVYKFMICSADLASWQCVQNRYIVFSRTGPLGAPDLAASTSTWIMTVDHLLWQLPLDNIYWYIYSEGRLFNRGDLQWWSRCQVSESVRTCCVVYAFAQWEKQAVWWLSLVVGFWVG